MRCQLLDKNDRTNHCGIPLEELRNDVEVDVSVFDVSIEVVIVSVIQELDYTKTAIIKGLHGFCFEQFGVVCPFGFIEVPLASQAEHFVLESQDVFTLNQPQRISILEE